MLMMMCDDEVWPSCRQGAIDGIDNVLSEDVKCRNALKMEQKKDIR